MSYCRKEGKDTIIFTTKEDHEKPSTVQISEPEPSPGLLLPDGSINWNCPCLGGLATGPCGVEFRGAFECFHYSSAEPRGSDCFGKFQEMQDCFNRFPKVYDISKEDTPDFHMDAGEENIDRNEISSNVDNNRGKSEIEDKAIYKKNESVIEKKM